MKARASSAAATHACCDKITDRRRLRQLSRIVWKCSISRIPGKLLNGLVWLKSNTGSSARYDEILENLLQQNTSLLDRQESFVNPGGWHGSMIHLTTLEITDASEDQAFEWDADIKCTTQRTGVLQARNGSNIGSSILDVICCVSLRTPSETHARRRQSCWMPSWKASGTGSRALPTRRSDGIGRCNFTRCMSQQQEQIAARMNSSSSVLGDFQHNQAVSAAPS